LRAADLTASDKQFLAGYEKVRAALAADDLAGAKKAAGELGNDSAAITAADKIATARASFAKLSEHAITLVTGQPGYYVVNCPMLKKDWVQTSDKISNPYAGKEMLTCGVVKK
jgi:poly-gamma-glutamate capsule biosynthesis protein CapA/YwtB (metallophosphatase superfamily)